VTKYQSLESGVFAVFNSSEWSSENIKTVPGNFVAKDTGDEFIAVSIIPGGESVNANSSTGLVMIDIYIPAGKGPRRASLIADKLDTHLLRRDVVSSTGRVQFPRASSLAFPGRDEQNPALFRATYSIPFNFFGAV
jgi:hypothetical protein